MRQLLAVAVVLTAFGCTKERQADGESATAAPSPSPSLAVVQKLPSPAGAGAAEPFLSASRDGLLLSWLEPVGETKRTALRFSRYVDGIWTAPKTIVERDDLFVNWADFPSIVEDTNGVLFVHWLQKSGKGTYSYDVRMATSRDGGITWGEPFLLNRDGKEAEHGFVTLAVLPEGGVGATWLDGRKMTSDAGHGDAGHEAGGDMTVRYARVNANGNIEDETEIDDRACECCTTGMAMATAGPVMVYRDRSPEEVRDISYVTKTSSGWTKPARVRSDDWKINACPVNGPQVDALGDQVVTAWFTASQEKGRAFVAFSSDGGKTFGNAIQIDDGKPIGRLDIVMLEPETALVTWLEQTTQGAEIRARRVRRDGSKAPASKIADSSTARAAGFARAVRLRDEVIIAWTEQSATNKTIQLAKGRF